MKFDTLGEDYWGDEGGDDQDECLSVEQRQGGGGDDRKDGGDDCDVPNFVRPPLVKGGGENPRSGTVTTPTLITDYFASTRRMETLWMTGMTGDDSWDEDMGKFADQPMVERDRPHDDPEHEFHRGPVVGDEHGELPRPVDVVEVGDESVVDDGDIWGTEDDETDWLSCTMPYISQQDPYTPTTRVGMVPDRVGRGGGALSSKDDFLTTERDDMESSLYWERVFNDTWSAKEMLSVPEEQDVMVKDRASSMVPDQRYDVLPTSVEGEDGPPERLEPTTGQAQGLELNQIENQLGLVDDADVLVGRTTRMGGIRDNIVGDDLNERIPGLEGRGMTGQAVVLDNMDDRTGPTVTPPGTENVQTTTGKQYPPPRF